MSGKDSFSQNLIVVNCNCNVKEWLEEVEIYCQQCKVPECEKAQVVLNHLKGTARDEIKCHGETGLEFKALS